VVAVGYGWTRSPRGAVAAFAAVLLLGALHPSMLAQDWMPYMYVPAYFAFLVALASVAAGRYGDLWIAAVTGWFCVHGHACFLLFVPALTLSAVLLLAWPRRRRLRAALRSFFRNYRRTWISAAAISAAFLLPIAFELADHWPGNFAKYFGYGSSSSAGGHGLEPAVRYMLWFWWPRHGLVVLAALGAAAIAVTWRCPAGQVRRVCVSLLILNAVSTVGLVAYAFVGIDEINEQYIGYFYWSAPVITALVIVLGGLEALARRPAIARAAFACVAAAGLAAGALFTVAGATQTQTAHADPATRFSTGAVGDPVLPGGVARLAAYAHGRTIVLELRPDTWPEMTGIVVQAQRTGVKACLADPAWTFMVTTQHICTHAQRAHGIVLWLWKPNTDFRGIHMHLKVVFRRAIVTNVSPSGVVAADNRARERRT